MKTKKRLIGLLMLITAAMLPRTAFAQQTPGTDVPAVIEAGDTTAVDGEVNDESEAKEGGTAGQDKEEVTAGEDNTAGEDDVTDEDSADAGGGTDITDGADTATIAETEKDIAPLDNTGGTTPAAIVAKVVHKADGTEEVFSTLIEAVNAAKAGDTIYLLSDYEVETSQNTSYWMQDGCTLDLDGHTLTVPYMTAIFEGTNITIQNGTFSSAADYAIWIGNGINATENVTLNKIRSDGGVNVFVAKTTLENCDINAGQKSYYALWGDEGEVEITVKGGSYKGGKGGAVINAFPGSGVDNPAAQIIIEGGEFTGKIGLDNATIGNVIISGGNFDNDSFNHFLKDNSTVATYTINGADSNRYAVGTAIEEVAKPGETITVLKGDKINVPGDVNIINSTGADITVNNTVIKPGDTPVEVHRFSEKWSFDGTNHYHACTGTDCPEVKDKAAHTYGEWTETKKATTTEKGTKQCTCSVCGYAQTEEIPVVVTENRPAPAAPARPNPNTSAAASKTGDSTPALITAALLMAFAVPPCTKKLQAHL